MSPTGAAAAATPPPTALPLWLLGLITINASIAMHLFAPAMPVAAADLQASPAQVQSAISVFLLGISIGHLICGPLAEAWGRRPVLLGGIVMFTLGSVAAAFATSLPVLLAARAVQALGASSGMALGRVIVRDTTEGLETVRRLALLGMVVMVSPGVSPMLGGVIASALGWRAVFGVLALQGLVALWMAYRRVPETGVAAGRFTVGRMLADYGCLLASRQYVAWTVGGGALSTAIFAFVTTAPFILTRQLGQPVAQAGLWTGLVLAGFVTGSAAASAIVMRKGSDFIIQAGLSLAALAAAALATQVYAGALGLAGLIGTMTLFAAGIGMSSAAMVTKAISLLPAQAASAMGMYGAVQMAFGTLTSALVSTDGDPAQACARTLLGMTLMACACLGLALREQRRAAAPAA